MEVQKINQKENNISLFSSHLCIPLTQSFSFIQTSSSSSLSFSLTDIQTSSSTSLSYDFFLSFSAADNTIQIIFFFRQQHHVFYFFSNNTMAPDNLLPFFISFSPTFHFLSYSITLRLLSSSLLHGSFPQFFTLRFMTIVTNKKKVTTSHFHLFSFFYHLPDLLFFLSFLCLVDIFLWELLIFVIFFCLMNVLLSDLLLLYDEIGWIEVFFSNLVFDVYFVFICSFLLVDVLLWDFSTPLQIQQR